jgi:hypothetical protein
LRNGANRGGNQLASIGISNENGGSHDRCKDQIRPEIQDGIFSGPGGAVTTTRSRTGNSFGLAVSERVALAMAERASEATVKASMQIWTHCFISPPTARC